MQVMGESVPDQFTGPAEQSNCGDWGNLPSPQQLGINTEGDIGGFWTPQYRKKIRQIPEYRKKKNRQIPQRLDTESKLAVTLKSVLCMPSEVQITLKLSKVVFDLDKINKT